VHQVINPIRLLYAVDAVPGNISSSLGIGHYPLLISSFERPAGVINE
jgi:hypothetical protein